MSSDALLGRCRCERKGGPRARLAVIVAPVILGGGKALFHGFTESLDLEQIDARQMEWATVIEYRVRK